MIHKKRSGSTVTSYSCKIGQHQYCEALVDGYDFVCHCYEENCSHEPMCDGSCQKPTVSRRTKAKTGSTSEEMGY